jgi:hypothetical protein
VFAYSFRSVNSYAEIYLFINEPIPKQTKIIAQDNDIILIPLDAYSHISNTIQHFHPSTIRWPLILSFLKQSKDKFQRLLFIDVRDSFFQQDPFKSLPTSHNDRFFYAFTGVETIQLKSCGWNSGWVKDCFDQDILRQIGTKNIICSGVTMADYFTAIDYLEKMTAIIKKTITMPYKSNNLLITQHPVSTLVDISKFPACERNGVDQGVHNVLVHTNSIPHIKIFKQSDGFVANMQSKLYRVDSSSYNVYALPPRGPTGGSSTSSSDTSEANSGSSPVNTLFSIVHQYDRHPQLQSFLFKKVSTFNHHSYH